jgi:nucleolysin TIA-1/TIAR
MAQQQKATSPQTNGAVTTQAKSPVGFATEQSRSLYIGNLDPRITEPLLFDIFSTIGPVESVKIIRDKTQTVSAGYGFVDYYDHAHAAAAIQQLNGRSVYGTELKVNWAYSSHKEDTSNHFHIFVGDLSPEINDKALYDAFAAFGSISEARVMWDQTTGRSRGYGFVAFRKKEDAEQAIREMNGEWLGSRAIRVNWANQKQNSTNKNVGKVGIVNSPDVQIVMAQSPPTNTTIYVGNLAPDTTDQHLREAFSEFGFIEEIRLQKDKGYAFLRFQTHENAARAIVYGNGRTVNNRQVKCAWGKDRTQTAAGTPTAAIIPPFAPGFQPLYNPYFSQGQFLMTPNMYPAAGYVPPQGQFNPTQYVLPNAPYPIGATPPQSNSSSVQVPQPYMNMTGQVSQAVPYYAMTGAAQNVASKQQPPRK